MTFRSAGAARVEFRPWITWDGPLTPAGDKGSAHTFRASWEATVDLLRDELAWLGATAAVIETGHFPHERRKDGAPHGSYHLATTGRDGVRLSFTAATGPLRFSTDTFYGWQTNLRAIALGLKALRAVDRYGIASGSEQYAGWAQLPAGTVPMTNARAVEIIRQFAGLPEGEPVITITKAWRAAIKAAHPDVNGGNPEAWAVLEPAGRHLGLI